MKKTFGFAAKFGALCLLLLCLFSTVSCSGDVETPDGMQLCSDKSLEYYFFVPTSWVVNTQSGSTSAYYSLDDPASVSVTSYSPEESMNVPGYFALCEEEYQSEFKNYVFISETKTIVSDSDAYEYVYTADFSGVTYKFNQTMFVYGGRIYTMTYTATADSYDNHLEAFASMKAEFTFR